MEGNILKVNKNHEISRSNFNKKHIGSIFSQSIKLKFFELLKPGRHDLFLAKTIL